LSRQPGLTIEITPQVLLKAYACGIFPMAESADDPGLYWIEPEFRGVIPLNGLVVSQRLARTIRSDRFEIAVDRDFEAVIDGCAAPAAGRRTTWINRRIRSLYADLFALGRSKPIRTGAWSAASTASISRGPFSVKACFTASAMPQRWRWPT
jgi:leucyl/phenylalanyl-tRNA--protein transferase